MSGKASAAKPAAAKPAAAKAAKKPGVFKTNNVINPVSKMPKRVVKPRKAGAKPGPIPEVLLKKRATKLLIKKHRTTLHKKTIAKAKVNRKVIFKRAENYVKEYRSAERNLITQRRVARSTGNFFVEPEAKLAFVIRIKGINQVPPKIRKILQLLRLRQVHNGVFVKLNSASLEMLRLVEPYVAWGYPNLKSVRELLYKRGFGKIHSQRMPLSSNKQIENALGRKGIICMEDLVHEIFTVGANFTRANNFVWPFKLRSPTGGFRKITTHFVEGGDAGNREEKINKLIRQMN